MKTQVKFYHMTVWPLERTLPRLMEIAHQRGIRSLVHAPKEKVDQLDKALWTFSPTKFLPHGTERDPYPDEQPILISHGFPALNKPSLLVMVDGTAYEGEHHFDRIFDLFDGTDDDEAAEARKRWKTYKDKGYELTYARQNDQGGWDEK